MFWVPQWNPQRMSFWFVSSDGGRECEAIMQVNEEDTLYRVTTPSVSKVGKDNDFILLASRRKPCDSRWFRGKTSLLVACCVCSIFLRCALSYSPQRSILDRPAFCQFAHPSAYWWLHPGRGALCWVHNQGGVRKSHQGQLNADKETQSKRLGFFLPHTMSDPMGLVSDHLLQPGHTRSPSLHLHRYRRPVFQLLQLLLLLQPLPGGQQECANSLVPVIPTTPTPSGPEPSRCHFLPVAEIADLAFLIQVFNVELCAQKKWIYFHCVGYFFKCFSKTLHVSSKITRYEARISTVSECIRL